MNVSNSLFHFSIFLLVLSSLTLGLVNYGGKKQTVQMLFLNVFSLFLFSLSEFLDCEACDRLSYVFEDILNKYWPFMAAIVILSLTLLFRKNKGEGEEIVNDEGGDAWSD